MTGSKVPVIFLETKSTNSQKFDDFRELIDNSISA
jgi:hypothetical protein